MDNTVIVKLLGRSIGYKALRSCIVSMWKPEGEIQIIDLDNGYYLVSFDHNDRIIALTKGPWTILGHYLTVEPWSPSFKPEENFPSTTVVWVRLPGMPFEYYHKSTLEAIVSVLGDLIKVHFKTQSVQRGKFA